MLQEDDPVPCDVIVLGCADKTAGNCYIDTTELDGETNLKTRTAMETLHRKITADIPAAPQQVCLPLRIR